MIYVCVFSAAVGGGEDLRRYWSDYMRKTHILVYVVDSSDRSRFPLAKAELHRLLRMEPQLPVVVLGNKQVDQMSRLSLLKGQYQRFYAYFSPFNTNPAQNAACNEAFSNRAVVDLFPTTPGSHWLPLITCTKINKQLADIE